MANHAIPRSAELVERIHGVDPRGDVVTCSVYRHTPHGHGRHMYLVVQYRWRGRRIDRSTRQTNQISGADADERLDRELRVTRALMAETRERAALAGRR